MKKNLPGRDQPHAHSRRRFLAPFALPFLWSKSGLAPTAAAQSAAITPTRFSSPPTVLTATRDFFIRSHFDAPMLPPSSTLRLSGLVGSPFEISSAELARQPAHTVTVTTECAGNAVGGVSTATWEGVPLGTLLKRARLDSKARYIRLVGADRGSVESETSIPFARSIPVEKALHPDTLIAFRMNGTALPVDHGYPLRAIVPGWYGMDSVKWLAGIEALEHADTSYFMTHTYVATRLKTIVGSDQWPVREMRVKSIVLEPHDGAVITPGLFTIRGVAWAGVNRIARVEVSSDAGKTWAAAILDNDVRPYTWVLWSCPREVPRGAYTIVVRATDDKGNAQPAARDNLRIDSYELNWYHTIHCEGR
jgi:DMSO/TMAO reductase YedYZ molybdopterin-dependent catalytic subunit